MFTGIVETTGVVERFVDGRLRVRATATLGDVEVGDSIALNGCGLAVVARGPTWWEVGVSDETIAGTSLGGVTVGDRVNLERAVTPGDRRLRLVQPHADRVAESTLHPRGAPSIRRRASARVPTEWGDFRCVAFDSRVDGGDTHLAFVRGDVDGRPDVLVRVQSECVTGDVFGSVKCDCGGQLRESMRRIAHEGAGVVLYLRGHEGRGIGIVHKLHAYELQDAGADTVDANTQLGLPVDGRTYEVGARILAELGLTTIRLLTNNPAKHSGLGGSGVTVTQRVPLHVPIHPEAARYVETKRVRMGHEFPSCGDDVGRGSHGPAPHRDV